MPRWRDDLRSNHVIRGEKGLQRELRPAEPGIPGHVLRDGVELIDLCSNDYLGLARNPLVIAAACEALERHGAGARASRLITGDSPAINELEHDLAGFKGCTSALIFPSGYQANLGLLSTLLGPDDAVFVDRLAHACVVDGVRLSPARLRVFPHNDLDRLESLLAGSAGAPNRWVLVDGVYSMDGDLAPLPELLHLSEKYDATVILDDAHGTGVVGATGRGTAEHFGIEPRSCEDRLIIMATLSKALGSQGGAVLGCAELRRELLNAARPFVYSTGLNPAAVGAASMSLRILREEPGMVTKLHQSTAMLKGVFHESGIATGSSVTPIIPLLTEAAVEISEALVREGVLVLPIRPPTVPVGESRLRLTATISLSEEELVTAGRLVAQSILTTLSQPSSSTFLR